MVIWVSIIIFGPIPTCILTKCEIHLGPKVWYNMKFKKTNSISQKWIIEHHTKYGQGGFGLLAFLHFLVRVPTYECSIPLGSLHVFVHCLEIPKFVHVGCMHTQPWLYLHVKHLFSTPSPCCWKVSSLGFEYQYIEILKHDPCLKLCLELIVQEKTINWYWCPKFYICNMLNYMLIVIFNTNANVHVLST